MHLSWTRIALLSALCLTHVVAGDDMWSEDGTVTEAPTKPTTKATPKPTQNECGKSGGYTNFCPRDIDDQIINSADEDEEYDDIDPQEKKGTAIDDDFGGQSAFEDVAFAKPAFQTSTWGVHHADHAVNGLSDNMYAHSPCSCTAFESHPQWWVDLKGDYSIKRVVLYSLWREEFKVREMAVEVSADGDVYTKCADIEDVGKPSMIYHRDCAGSGRFLRIRSDAKDPHNLCICSIKVFGRRKDAKWDARLVSEGMPSSMFPVDSNSMPHLANDGGIHARPWGHTVLNIPQHGQNFWEVDLQRLYNIDRVVIYFGHLNNVFYMKVLTDRKSVV